MRANTGLPYELVVQSIFQEILDQDGACTIRVEHDVELQGRTTTHQIDVLWRFEIGGIKILDARYRRKTGTRGSRRSMFSRSAVSSTISPDNRAAS